MHFAGLPVDDEAVGFATEQIGRNPHRQQDMFEGEVAVLGIEAGNALMVAADVGLHQLLHFAIDDLFGFDEAFFQTDLIRLGLKADDVFFLIGHDFFGVPGAQIAGAKHIEYRQIATGGCGGAVGGFARRYQHIIMEE